MRRLALALFVLMGFGCDSGEPETTGVLLKRKSDTNHPMDNDKTQHGFELESERLRVMDPADDGVEIENCYPGRWNASVQITPVGDLEDPKKQLLLVHSGHSITGIQPEVVATDIIGSTCFHAIYDSSVVKEQDKISQDPFERIMTRVKAGGEALGVYEGRDDTIASIRGGLVFLWNGGADCSIYRDADSKRIIAVEIHGHSLH